ncbi:MAG: replication-associated recombination protein A [Psychrobacter sp.]|jgi:putative ATPase|uniref:Replication-associated recombination protein A n=1 Tax=Psychrobacter namhaensis TaxID=292734 RepID=A0ABW8L704_9GAMM|nr:replication-associated recombination protein A [Psychrobacter sp. CCUG 69069]MCD1278688.1 replication-associated recombination protein A [Psychrobacter sp. CCUG 69069]MCD6250725.1 replication-associated recombination protein A [Psychrobacter sp.]
MPPNFHADTPLAQRMRPTTLDAIIGQTHLLAAGAPLRRLVEQGHLPSIILHGEAGIGKTTIAMLLADAVGRPFHALSALNTGVKQLREVLDHKDSLSFESPVVFIDEIHRFNKAQQDALLGAVESGDITLIGATTENPSFSVNNALLSRCQVYRLEPLTSEQISAVLQRALSEDNVLKKLKIDLQAQDTISQLAHGDARKALNVLELAVQTADAQHSPLVIDNELVGRVAQTALVRYDKDGEQHYDIISAMIKSVRGSDPDAALYWMARMLVGGEPADFIARRLVILASEDIGNANPNALLLADAALRSVQSIGMPEARIILGQVVVYLATSAKSNSTYKAINAAMALAEKDASPVPLHLRNGVTKLMRTQGYGQGYAYPHDYPNHYYPQTYLPDNLLGTSFYTFADNQREQHSKQFMNWLKNQAASND